MCYHTAASLFVGSWCDLWLCGLSQEDSINLAILLVTHTHVNICLVVGLTIKCVWTVFLVFKMILRVERTDQMLIMRQVVTLISRSLLLCRVSRSSSFSAVCVVFSDEAVVFSCLGCFFGIFCPRTELFLRASQHYQQIQPFQTTAVIQT